MFTPPEGWPQEATFPPERDEIRMYNIYSESRDNKLVTVQFWPEYGGQQFIVPKQEPEYNEDTTIFAALNGHLEYLKYLHENGYPWNIEATRVAASNGHLDCMKYLYRNGCPCSSEIWYHFFLCTTKHHN